MAQQEVGGRVNSVDSRGDVTYPHSFHQYTTLGKHSFPRGDVTRDNAMVTTQQLTTLAALRNNTGKDDDRQQAIGNGIKSRRTSQ
jgi:hypothetical protein